MAEDTDHTIDEANSGCARTLLLYGVAAISLVLCGILSGFLGNWLMYAWFVTWLIVFSWRGFGPIGALLYLIAAGAGWWFLMRTI